MTAKLIIGAPGVVRICSVQDFVDHFGEGHRWHDEAHNWFHAGGRELVFSTTSGRLEQREDGSPERVADVAKESPQRTRDDPPAD
ncbi:MAG TPA: hypothetical protein ENH89_20005 [Aurantimonas coralicida]|uniref:Uncharacterized protein n=1 Tax=Aurantimonas coralicida TaxID=182270 RepID=A0A9C9NIP6_9HYPH|nr:hypothetical protein [Aurantimonas coralicida]